MTAERKTTDRAGWAPEVGVPRTRAEVDQRRDPILLAAIAQVAPGTELRAGIDDIIRSNEGALIVIGDPDELSFLYSGGISSTCRSRRSCSTSSRRWTGRSSSTPTSAGSPTRTSS